MLRLATIFVALAAPAAALDLAQCTRTTHVSHGGEAMHRDLGAGRVAWAEWWSQEGVYVDAYVADCTEARALSTRLREENVRDRHFDRRDAGLAIIDRHTRRDPALFSLAGLADELKNTGEDIRLDDMAKEPCACASLYPDMRGAMMPFALN
jgi:hypothetical protein